MAMYLSKEIVLAAYKQLRYLTDDPMKQGQTQKTSILRYAVALDIFGEKYHRNLDMADFRDRQRLTEIVGDLVYIEPGGLYTADFFKSLRRSDDYMINQNFSSAGVVPDSGLSPSETFWYPRRYPRLFALKNKKLLYDTICYENLRDYLKTPQLQCAFIVWINRNRRFTDLADNETFDIELQRSSRDFLSEEMVAALWNEESFTPQYLTIADIEAFTGTKLRLEKSDIEGNWPGGNGECDIANDVAIGASTGNFEYAFMRLDQSLSIQYHEGNPQGIRICESPTSKLTSIIIPRNRLVEARLIKNLPPRGIYYLFQVKKDSIKKAYVGQTVQGTKRLDEHNSSKEWWNIAIMHLAQNNDLSRDVIDRLEALGIEQLEKSSCTSANKKGNQIPVSTLDEGIAKQLFQEIRFRNQALGFLI